MTEVTNWHCNCARKDIRLSYLCIGSYSSAAQFTSFNPTSTSSSISSRLFSLHAGIHLASALKASAWTWWAHRQTTLWVWGVTSVIWYASWSLTLFVICNGRSRQDASDHVKCFINTAQGNISSPKSVRWIKFTYLRFSTLSRVILRGFGTVNSPLCIDAPPKAKEKHKACKEH